MCSESARKRRENGILRLKNSTKLQRYTSPVRAPVAAKTPGTIAHVTPDGISARFALDSICKSMAAEIRVVLINSSYFWSFLDCHVHISSITPSFYTGIFAPYLSGKWSGAYLLAERERLKVLGRLLPILYKCDYEFIV